MKKNKLIICFRVDASFQIGTGHVMRCLALACALREKKAKCHFICREHKGHLIDTILQYGFEVSSFGNSTNQNIANNKIKYENLEYSEWLGSDWKTDANETASVLRKLKPDWLITDHYSIDSIWENSLKPYYNKLMVIDDLANRSHVCDLLLDQNYGRNKSDYKPWVNQSCTQLYGPKHALLMQEFSDLRKHSIERRKKSTLKNILITMGGVDKDNAVCKVLEVLDSVELPKSSIITIVMGTNSLWIADVEKKANLLKYKTNIKINVDNMAKIMCESDLSIGAAGSTSWERCCLGLPTLLVTLSENQKYIAESLDLIGAGISVGSIFLSDFKNNMLSAITKCLCESEVLKNMTKISKSITRGQGAEICVKKIFSLTV